MAGNEGMGCVAGEQTSEHEQAQGAAGRGEAASAAEPEKAAPAKARRNDRDAAVMEPDEVEDEAATAGDESAEAGDAADDEAVADAEAAADDAGFIEVEEEERVIVMRRSAFYGLAALVAALIIALAAVNIYQWQKNSGPTVATVNGATITRADYDKAVARGDGGDILDSLITRKLVELDAKKRGVSVSPDEIDTKVKEAKARIGAEADWQAALAQQHLTELQVRDTFRLNVMVEKLVYSSVQVADSEVQQQYDQGKDTQYKDKSFDDVKAQIKSDLTTQKQQSALQDYLTNLKDTAKITKRLPGA